MQVVQIVAPTTESITLIEAKAFVRVLHDDDNILIKELIDSTCEHTQEILNRQLEVATYELYTDDFISKLPKNPISSILKIEYMDATGAYVELDSDTYYLYENNGIGYIHYESTPSVLQHKKAVKITFVCGYYKIPSPIKSYMRVLIATAYEHREKYVIGVVVSEFNDGLISQLLKPYRIMP
ncbi:MAG: phage head-tail connector protein [Sulfurimonas sp.]|nr:phage head-tail connector protein [Sulfurimonas sp.]PHQ90110.1 MAG: hypothetical protein COB42_05705 [Sulfurimonas sp.]